MNRASKALGAAAIAAGIALNPYVVARLLYGTGSGGPREMRSAFWVVACVLVVFGALVLAGRLRVGPRLSKVVLALLVTITTVLLLVVADRVVGKVRGKPAVGLIFPPSSEVGYETPEFRVVVKSNSLGFRGDEVPAAKGSAYRIVAIGDSFTMGWGLGQQDTWTALLQKRLRGDGGDVEVLNLGQGGADVFALAALGDRCPLAVLEAMSAEAPVVATRVGGIPEELESGATGVLVPPRDPTLL